MDWSCFLNLTKANCTMPMQSFEGVQTQSIHNLSSTTYNLSIRVGTNFIKINPHLIKIRLNQTVFSLCCQLLCVCHLYQLSSVRSNEKRRSKLPSFLHGFMLGISRRECTAPKLSELMKISLTDFN